MSKKEKKANAILLFDFYRVLYLTQMCLLLSVEATPRLVV